VRKIWFLFLAAISMLRLPSMSGIIRRYSTQLGFMLLICLFLAVTVGEGQAYDLPTPNIAAHFSPQTKDGFLGKPQFFSDQTVLTGEVQQTVAMVHAVEQGDSIIAIAKRYDISVGSILEANNMKPAEAEKIKPGTQLIIPAEDTDTSLAWLDSINKAKEDERKKAEALRQKQLAETARAQQRARANQSTGSSRTVYSSSSGHDIIGRMWGEYNGGVPGYCTWYVNYKRPDLPNGMGNARDYIANARARGMATGKSPRAGAVMVTGESGYGHVGVVESVSGDRVTITEMNYAGRGVIDRRTLSIYDAVIRGYVY
jgi:surface antigen